MSLTDTGVRSAKPRQKRYKVSDGRGLYLLIEANGSKLWRFKYRFAGKEKKLALGAYPEVTLAMARDRHIDARRMLANGIDPAEYRKQSRRSAKVAAANTFEAIAREWIAKFTPIWAPTHTDKIVLRLENEVFPWVGRRPISAIEADELLEVIRRVEARGALETARRCLSYCSQVFRYAIATAGRARRNPAADLRGALPYAKVTHFASITEPKGVGELMRAIDGYEGNFITRCALRLAPLVFVRPAVLREAQWEHFDLEAAEWRVPRELMKMDEDLIVPLSRQALAILNVLKPRTGHGRYLFPSERSIRRAMSNNTINAALRRLGYSTDEMTGHGFRAMARTILDEVLNVRVDWIEHQLAHRVRDTNGRAYNRTAFLEGRRQMMQRWADYLDELRTTKLKQKAAGKKVRAALNTARA